MSWIKLSNHPALPGKILANHFQPKTIKRSQPDSNHIEAVQNATRKHNHKTGSLLYRPEGKEKHAVPRNQITIFTNFPPRLAVPTLAGVILSFIYQRLKQYARKPA